MKKIYLLWLLPLLCLLAGCSENPIDDLGGKYDYVKRFNFENAEVGQTLKLKKGFKELNIGLSNAQGEKMDLKVYLRDWVLQPGAYTVAESITEMDLVKNFTFIGSTENNEYVCSEGSLNVVIENGLYKINGIFTDRANEGAHQFVVNYKGKLEFIVGEDDPEPSGYKVTMSKQQATIQDPVTYQPIPLPGLSKYTFKITDPDGNDAGAIDAINATDVDITALAGTYKIQGNPDKAWLMDNGWTVPDWGMAGGTYFVAPDGKKQYITGGELAIEFVDGINGEQLINFAGSALPFINADGTPGTTTNVSLKFAEMLTVSGTELRDLKINSAVLGREVPYSVFLPDGYDGTKSYPVLYMLHGAAGNNNDWLQNGMVSAFAASAGRDMVVVCPCATLDGFDTFYINNYAGKGVKYEEFFFTELLPKVEADFKIKPGKENRGISGLSMGGYGSLYYGLGHADMFCHIYACSPATWIENTPHIYEMMWVPGLPGITVEIGTKDFLYESACGFREALKNSQIQWDFIEREGAHDWAFWTACTPKILKKFSEIFPAE